jgi:hypothetical protein
MESGPGIDPSIAPPTGQNHRVKRYAHCPSPQMLRNTMNKAQIIVRGKTLACMPTPAGQITERVEQWARLRSALLVKNKEFEGGYFDLKIVSPTGQELDNQIEIA